MAYKFKYLLLLLLIIFLGVFLLLPMFIVIKVGCNWQLVVEVFNNQVYLEGLINSFSIALVTTLITAILSLTLALVYDRFDFPGKEWCGLSMLLPMILPPFVGALGFQQILGHYGVINTILDYAGFEKIDFLGGTGRFWSVCFIEALHLYPIFYLNLVTSLGNIDPALVESAANLGASRTQRFFKIQLPMLKSGLLAGGSIVLIWSFTELGTPLMFGYNRTTAVQIFNGLTELGSNPLPFTLVVIMLVFSSIMYLFSKLVLGGTTQNATKGNIGSSATRLISWRKYLPLLLFGVVTLFAVLPHIALIETAFSLRYYGTLLPEHFTMLHVENALSNSLVIPSIMNSLRYSFLAMIFATVIGVITSLSSIRWRLVGSSLADLLSMLPLAVPGVVIAFGYLGMTAKFYWAKELFNPVDNPVWLLSIAYAVRRIPYVVRSVSAGLEQTPEELENAARNFGASPWRVFLRITIPLVSANLLVGGLFAFSFSMLEVSDSLLLAHKAEFYPITRALFELSQILGSGPGTASAFGVWTMVFLASTLGVAGLLLGRKIGSIFRF